MKVNNNGNIVYFCSITQMFHMQLLFEFTISLLHRDNYPKTAIEGKEEVWRNKLYIIK